MEGAHHGAEPDSGVAGRAIGVGAPRRPRQEELREELSPSGGAPPPPGLSGPDFLPPLPGGGPPVP